MIYLSGHVRPTLLHPLVGFMYTPWQGNLHVEGRIWGADNGCFSSPEKYTDDKYLSWLDSRPRDGCLFATARDVLADHVKTLALSIPLFPRIKALGYPAAFVAQDGWKDYNTPWDDFDVLFIGGTDSFKLCFSCSAIESARRRGKWIHMGRVNSFQRLSFAAFIGCDSVDGTYLKFGPDINTPRLLRWLERLEKQPVLA